MLFPEGYEEYIVFFTRQRSGYFRGETYVEQDLVQRPDRAWFQENVYIRIEEFPVRIACTGSMRPVIDCGDEVIFEPAPRNGQLQVGDMVTFRFSRRDVEVNKNCYSRPSLRGTTYILHRIHQRVRGSSPPRYITKGDNNPVRDPCSVSENSIIFRVAKVNKNVYVIDQPLYDEYVREHQQLLDEYFALREEYADLRERYFGSLAEYCRMRYSGAQQSELDSFYNSLESLRRQINRLRDEINQLWQDLSAAQRRIASVVR